MIRNSQIQFAAPEEIKKFQEERLREELRYLADHSRFYQAMFRNESVDIRDIRTLEDLRQLPVTTKKDLQKQNDDFLCVSRREVIDYNFRFCCSVECFGLNNSTSEIFLFLCVRPLRFKK